MVLGDGWQNIEGRFIQIHSSQPIDLEAAALLCHTSQFFTQFLKIWSCLKDAILFKDS